MSRQLYLRLLAVLSFGLTPVMWSQQDGASALPATSAADHPSQAPAQTAATDDSAAADATDAPAAPSQAVTATAADPSLRELGTDAEEVQPTRVRGKRRSGSRGSSNERVGFGQDIILQQGETAGELVAIAGSATANGEVENAVVSILGSTRINAPIGGEAVAVLGSVYVNSRVGGDVVAVMGNVVLGPEAEVNGEVVVIGGALTRDPAAIVNRGVQNVGFGMEMGGLEWLGAYFRECVLKLRPLAFNSEVAWAWAVAFAFLGFYVLLALLFRRGIEKCTETVETRPGYSVLAAFLTVLLTPVAVVLLAFTVIGLALVPFLSVALFFAALFGKAVMLAWLGRRITAPFGNGLFGHPAFAVIIGGLVVMLLYVVPVLGFLLFKLLGWLGLGVVVYTLVLISNRDRPAAVAAPLPAPAPAPAGGEPPPLSPVAPEIGEPAAGASATASMVADPAIPTVSAGSGAPSVAAPVLSPVVAATTLPRAGLMIRLGALLLDLILVAVVVGMLTSWLPREFRMQGAGILPILALYGALMWKMKGTTIGGIICGLKVVRLDNRELDWATAIVRALSCFLSLLVAGLGFLWVAFDDGRQSWHDKIAGTTVVRVPKGVSLI